MEETGAPGGNHRPTASNWWNFFTHTASAQSGDFTDWHKLIHKMEMKLRLSWREAEHVGLSRFKWLQAKPTFQVWFDISFQLLYSFSPSVNSMFGDLKYHLYKGPHLPIRKRQMNRLVGPTTDHEIGFRKFHIPWFDYSNLLVIFLVIHLGGNMRTSVLVSCAVGWLTIRMKTPPIGSFDQPTIIMLSLGHRMANSLESSRECLALAVH